MFSLLVFIVTVRFYAILGVVEMQQVFFFFYVTITSKPGELHWGQLSYACLNLLQKKGGGKVVGD